MRRASLPSAERLVPNLFKPFEPRCWNGMSRTGLCRLISIMVRTDHCRYVT